MDELSRSVRGNRAGKLTEVLRHGLRGMADPQDQDNIAKSYIERGLPVPEQLTAPPRILPEHQLYWTAYADLQHDRPDSGFGGKLRRISWASIAKYAEHHHLNVDDLKRFIWALDSEFINAKKKPDEKPNGAGDPDNG